MLPFTRVRVVGPSMEPSVHNGDWWLVRRTASVGPGDVVLLVHPARPHAQVVKRIERREGDGWWVLGDNAGASEDSRQFGVVPAANVIGTLWWRYRHLHRGGG
ncbi:MAG: nickel-type superoxide dismutase maturation protease [Actinobacteria bacterium]|nr:nickel-type superoxide dismutase maturation protease [Actinomycetota bacterium]